MPEIKYGDCMVSSFSNRAGRVVGVYTNHVLVQFEGYQEPTKLGWLAAREYHRPEHPRCLTSSPS
ncbi:hypothetical protein [Micromonospora aurantiaca (nom. illeg.)]|uniref:hypothetical protein n=1 Tax=Micromonospora aurantiaca (nom. illeg.) TaxID=47850 RepID=UPI0033F8DE74